MLRIINPLPFKSSLDEVLVIISENFSTAMLFHPKPRTMSHLKGLKTPNRHKYVILHTTGLRRAKSKITNENIDDKIGKCSAYLITGRKFKIIDSKITLPHRFVLMEIRFSDHYWMVSLNSYSGYHGNSIGNPDFRSRITCPCHVGPAVETYEVEGLLA